MGGNLSAQFSYCFDRGLKPLFFATVILSQQHDRINWLNNQLLHMEFLPKVASTNKRCMKTWYCTCRFLVFPLSPQWGLNWHFEVWSSTDFCVSIFQCFLLWCWPKRGLRRAGNNLHEAEQCLVNEIRNRSEKFGRGVHASASVLDEEYLA